MKCVQRNGTLTKRVPKISLVSLSSNRCLDVKDKNELLSRATEVLVRALACYIA